METKEQGPAPRLKLINYVVIGIVALVAAFLLYTTVRTLHSYRELQQDTERYVSAQHAAEMMRDASDELTHQAQLYTLTGDWTCVQRYFEEADATRRRDTAVEEIRKLSPDKQSLAGLESAMEHSVALMDRECRAMRLMLEAGEERPAEIPEALMAVELSEEEQVLSSVGKQERARELVFSYEYISAKEEIYRDVLQCTSQLMQNSRAYQLDSADELYGMLMREQVLIILLLILVMVFCFLTSRLLIAPLERNIKRMQASQPMKVCGAYEMRLMAQNYNELYERNTRDKEQLSYEAAHDPLTGVGNRKAYEKAIQTADESQIALIIADVDDFKHFNDEYGHEVGDLVLQRVVKVLRMNFRSEDQICRIGGDEFVVLMMTADSSLEGLVTRKVQRLQDLLREPENGTPGVTVSVGIAFGDREQPAGSIFHDADVALYVVKERGRNGFAFYDGASMAERAATSHTKLMTELRGE